MKSFFLNGYISSIARIILGLIFILASVGKIVTPELFALNIQAYQILPPFLINICAIIIPWLELVCGIFLVCGILVQASAIIIFGLLVVFMSAIISAILRGLSIDCGCFDFIQASTVSWMRVVEDIVMLAFAIFLIYFPKSKFALENFYNSNTNKAN